MSVILYGLVGGFSVIGTLFFFFALKGAIQVSAIAHDATDIDVEFLKGSALMLLVQLGISAVSFGIAFMLYYLNFLR